MGQRGLCHPNVKCGLWSKELGLICVHGVSAGCQEASLRGFWWVTAVPHSRLQPPCSAAQLAASFGGLELFFFLELCQTASAPCSRSRLAASRCDCHHPGRIPGALHRIPARSKGGCAESTALRAYEARCRHTLIANNSY